jgi:PAS domain S-box-containing protein
MDTAVVANIIATSLMILTYTYLYFQYKHIYLAMWMTAWILHEVRIVFFEIHFLEQSSLILILIFLLLCFAYNLLMIMGTFKLVGRQIPRLWLITSFTILLTSTLGMLLNFPKEVYIFPGILFIGLTYIGAGVVIQEINIRGLGKQLTTWAFIILGLHTLDMPFLLSIDWFVPWGYLIDGVLRSVVAIGTVFIYFEKMREELATKEKYYRLLAENATDVIYRYQLIFPVGFEYISPAVRELTGYDPTDIKTLRDVMRIIHPADRGNFKKLIKSPNVLNEFTTLRVVHKNGDILWVEPKQNIVAGSDGQLLAVEGIMRDITNRVLLEQDVSRLDRLNIVGQMAANLAHEVRNPLTTVRGYLQMFGNKREFQNYKEQFTLLLDELDRTNHIITEYLALSKNKSIDMKKSNLNEIILTIHPLIQADAVSSNIETILELDEIPSLHLDAKEIKQLILNFTRNAVEAMPSGGRLTIKTAVNGNEITLSVSDQGTGIPQQVLDNLGKPFLTTKPTGTGLGMAICYRIAHRHNAKLDIDTGPAGTTIHIRFPRN